MFSIFFLSVGVGGKREYALCFFFLFCSFVRCREWQWCVIIVTPSVHLSEFIRCFGGEIRWSWMQTCNIYVGSFGKNDCELWMCARHCASLPAIQHQPHSLSWLLTSCGSHIIAQTNAYTKGAKQTLLLFSRFQVGRGYHITTQIQTECNRELLLFFFFLSTAYFSLRLLFLLSHLSGWLGGWLDCELVDITQFRNFSNLQKKCTISKRRFLAAVGLMRLSTRAEERNE